MTQEDKQNTFRVLQRIINNLPVEDLDGTQAIPLFPADHDTDIRDTILKQFAEDIDLT